jgi:hypothetical protein
MTETSLREEILAHRATRERKLAVCGGGGLAPEERVELLAVLASDAEEAIAQRAAGALLSQPLEAFVKAAARKDAAPQLIVYCAENLADKPGMAGTLALNPACPQDIVVRLAPLFTPEIARALADDWDRLSTMPTLIPVLADSPHLSLDQKRVLHELQKEEADPEALEKAISDAEPDIGKRQTLLQKLGKMRVVERIKVALTGNREERMVLIRESNKLVQRAVLSSPKLTDNEVESFAAMASLSDEALRLIAGNRQFIKSYVVVKNLMNNPKTPLDVSLHLLPRLNPLDLKSLTNNKNVPETLRTLATKMVRQRSQAKASAE